MQSKIHVQHVVLSLQPGGLENGVVNVVNHLDPMRFRSSVCCLRDVGTFAARIQSADVQIHNLSSSGGLDWSLPYRLARIFRSTSTDIVHTRNPEAYFFGFLGAKLAGTKAIIHSEHGRTFNDRAIRLHVQRWFSRYTDVILALSQQLKNDLVLHIGIPPSRVEVVYNGVDIEGAKKIKRNGKHQGISAGKFTIGSVGRLVPVKNYQLLLRAVRRMEKEDVQVVLIGDGPERASLENLALELGIAKQTIFLGHCNDVFSQLASMDVFVLPSFSEGISNTMLEAMACGIPVIASNVGGNPEILKHSVEGLLFENNDESELTSNLLSMYGDPAAREKFALAGRARVERDFSMAAMISTYAQLYSRVYCSGVH